MTSPATPPAAWLAEPPVLDDVTTVEGWNRYVTHRHEYQPPPLITRTEYEALPEGHRALYDMARETALANQPKHETPMTAALRRSVVPTLRLNSSNANPGVRPGIFVSADAGLGKSTVMREIAAAFDTRQRARAQFFPSIAGNRDRWVPVAWVNVPSKVTIKGLCAEILGFYGEMPRTVRHVSETALTARVNELIVACGTRLLVLDDITRMKMHREADMDAADFVRSLMETAATIIGIGVNVEASGLLYEGQASARNRHLLTQTRRRFSVERLLPFTSEDSETANAWLSHLRAIEENLPLLDKSPGMLTDGDTPAYLLRRTDGVIGSLSRLVTEASLLVLGNRPTGPGTGEYLSRSILSSVTLDHAAEHSDVREPPTPPEGRVPARRSGRSRNTVFNGNRPRRGVA
jgi:hypothetical protein